MLLLLLEKQNTEIQLDLPDSRRDSITLLCHIIPLPSLFIVPSSASTRSNAVPAVYPSYLILCHLLICILATIAATAHRWHLWEKIMDQVEGQFPAPRCRLGNRWSAIDLDVPADVLIPEKSVSILLPCFEITQKNKGGPIIVPADSHPSLSSYTSVTEQRSYL